MYVSVFIKAGLPSFLIWDFPICPMLMQLSLRVFMETSRAAQSAAVGPGFNGETGSMASEARETESPAPLLQRQRSRVGRSEARAPGLPHLVLSNLVTQVTPDSSFCPGPGKLAPWTTWVAWRPAEGKCGQGILGPSSLPPGLL